MIDDAAIKLGDLVGWLAGLLVAVLGWMGRAQMKRIDAHEERLDGHAEDITAIRVTALTKADLTSMEARITSAITASATHMAERIGDVKATADKAHDRLDRLPRA